MTINATNPVVCVPAVGTLTSPMFPAAAPSGHTYIPGAAFRRFARSLSLRPSCLLGPSIGPTFNLAVVAA